MNYRKLSIFGLLISLLLQACVAYTGGAEVDGNRVADNNSGLGTYLPVLQIDAGESAARLPLSPLYPRSDANLDDILVMMPSLAPEMTKFSPGLSISDWVETRLAEMTLEEKVGQMILTGIEGTEITPEACQYIQLVRPGGVTFQHGNVIGPGELRQFTTDLHACMQAVGGVPLIMTLAHEGQYINRFRQGATPFPAALAQGATMDPEVAYQAALAAGQELAYSGITMVLGPVADVLLNYDNDVISERTYGGEVEAVSQFVSQAVSGYRLAGVIPVLKHFPGHGGVAEDSHLNLPVDPVDLDGLRSDYLPPFQRGVEAGAPVIMLSHIAYPQISTAETPATLSPEVIRFMREELNFEGVILSDSLRMKAVRPTLKVLVPEVAVEAALAGVDWLLLNSPEQALGSYEFLIAAVGRGELSMERVDAAVRRLLTLKAMHGLTSYPLLLALEPDWEAHLALAYRLGQRAVAELKDPNGLVPVPANLRRILVIGPGTEWDLYPRLAYALQTQGHETDFVHYAPPWEGAVDEPELLERLPRQAQDYDLVVLFTWQVHLNKFKFEDNWQIELVKGLTRRRIPLIAVAIKSPTDILEYPRVPAYLAMYGSTPGQEDALLAILLGQMEAEGGNPLPDLQP